MKAWIIGMSSALAVGLSVELYLGWDGTAEPEAAHPTSPTKDTAPTAVSAVPQGTPTAVANSCVLPQESAAVLEGANDRMLFGANTFAFDLTLSLSGKADGGSITYIFAGDGHFIMRPDANSPKEYMSAYAKLKGTASAVGAKAKAWLAQRPTSHESQIEFWFVDGIMYGRGRAANKLTRQRCELTQIVQAGIGEAVGLPSTGSLPIPDLGHLLGQPQQLLQAMEQVSGFPLDKFICSQVIGKNKNSGKDITKFHTTFDLDRLLTSAESGKLLATLMGSQAGTDIIAYALAGLIGQTYSDLIKNTEVSIEKHVPNEPEARLSQLHLRAKFVPNEKALKTTLSNPHMNIHADLGFHGYDKSYEVTAPSGFEGVACQ